MMTVRDHDADGVELEDCDLMAGAVVVLLAVVSGAWGYALGALVGWLCR